MELQFDFVNDAFEPYQQKPAAAAKLTVIQVQAIRSDGRKPKELAPEYGVSDTCIRNVQKHRSWAWVE